ncbi:MAG: SDR family NAD(P)-dependent oxidoreductase [Brevinema sp.]
MNILVTGGAGFIGSHLVDTLLKEGHTVVVLDDLSLGREENLVLATQNKNFIFFKEDILDSEKLHDIFNKHKFDIVFHMAANSDIAISHKNPDVDFNKTLMTTYNILKAMEDHEVYKIVFASTSAIYGNTLGRNADEAFAPLFPISHYGAAKLASEAFISSFGENYNIQSWIVRFPNVVGDRATHGVLFDFINRLKKDPSKLNVLGNGTQFKPYLYVKDLVDAMIYIWKNSNDKVNFFNVGVDSQTTVREIAEITIEEMGLSCPINYQDSNRGWIGDVPKFSYNLDKIHQLGWKAKKSSNDAVRKAIQYIIKENY